MWRWIFLWRVEFFKIGKRDFTFIREMRVPLATVMRLNWVKSLVVKSNCTKISTLKLFNQNYPLTTQANMLFHSGKYFTFLNLSHMGKEKYCSHQPPEAFIHKVIRRKNFTYVAFVSTRSSFVQLYERGIVEP